MSYDATLSRPEQPALINLRGAAEACPVFAKVLDCALPQPPDTVARTEVLDILYLGPDEWLVVAAEAEEHQLFVRLSDALAGKHAAVTPVSDQYAVFELAGSEVGEVMAQACAIDLHPGRFGADQCARCAFARITAIVQMLDETPRYRLLVEATYAHYIALWFSSAVGLVFRPG